VVESPYCAFFLRQRTTKIILHADDVHQAIPMSQSIIALKVTDAARRVPVQDAIAAQLALQNAQKMNLGRSITYETAAMGPGKGTYAWVPATAYIVIMGKR
jgi:hypothetical protein